MNQLRNQARVTVLSLVLILLGACLLYLFILNPDRFGAYHDDGIYVMTARTLATGQGYKIASLPYEPAETKYPPLYPFLLSLIWRVYPQFPQNLIWMIFLSFAATIGFLALTYRYLTHQRYATHWQALIVVALAAINWRTMILATSIYSEMTYALLSVAVLEIAEDFENQGSKWTRALLTLLMGLAFLTRTLGVTLIAAVGLYYALKGKLKMAVAAAATVAIFVIGWMAWCSANRTSAEGVNVAYYTSYLGHLNEVVQDLQSINHTSKLAVVSSIVFQNLIGGLILSVPLVCSGFEYGFIAGISGPILVAAILSFVLILFLICAGFLRQILKGLRLLHVYVFTSLVVCLFWLPNVSYDRFLMPLLPFLLLFAVVELDRLMKLARREFLSAGTAIKKASAAIVGLVLLLPAGMTLQNYGYGVKQLFDSFDKNAARAKEDDQAFAWIKANADPSDTLVCYRDPKYFLYTGHKATRFFPMKAGVSWQEDPASMKNLTNLTFQIIGEANGRYVVMTSTDFELEDQPEQHRRSFRKIVEDHPEKFVPAFASADGRSQIYRIQNDAR